MRHMSESVFVGLCRIVGTSEQVAMRRDVADIREFMSRKITRSQEITMLSGSTREGFRLLGSDKDMMTWSDSDRVIWDLSQTRYYMSRKILILSDSSDSPPGFTLLQLLSSAADIRIRCACVKINNRLYISSSFYRLIMHVCESKKPDETTHIHGPCSSGNRFGNEFDLANCFVSDFWPPLSSSWIQRCHAWPKPQVVSDIVKNGCHFVAIGHKLGNHEDKEWRISFSLAEQKLAYSFNHSQFLTYGLLKLYLKEVINSNVEPEEKLLCSYHMKTAIFWVLQQDLLSDWCPQTLLEGFWICFKLILKWVYEGVCPNFFIPKNNMFLSNIHGEKQMILFLRLYTLYENGISCLLQSPSIRSYIVTVLCNPTLFICTNKMNLIPEYRFYVEAFNELLRIILGYTSALKYSVNTLKAVERLIKSHLTQYHVLVLQRLVALILRRTAFILQGMHTYTGPNKRIYIADKMSLHMLWLAVKFSFISEMLFVAMFQCKTRRYTEALSIIELITAKLAYPQEMFLYFTYIIKDPGDVRSQSWSSKMRNTMLNYIPLETGVSYINEIMLEQLCSFKNNITALYVPTVVLIRALEFLCHTNLNKEKAQIILFKLRTLVHSDHLFYLPEAYKDITWQILGICQQINEDFQAAFYSYQQSLRQYPIHRIQTATIIRVIILMYKLYFN